MKSASNITDSAGEDLVALGYREIKERNLEILELYKEGKTLQEIGKVFGITRERVRQIAGSTIKQLVTNESALKGVRIDTDIFNDGISKKRHLAQEVERMARHPKIAPKERRWSMYYLSCRSCGTTSIPHVRKGLCEECLGIIRADRREDIIAKHNNRCDTCGKTRADARVDYGRDLFITKEKDVQCLGCFRKRTGKILGGYSNYKWSRFHEKCKKCGTTTVPYVKGGLCENCCDTYSDQQREDLIKAHNDQCDFCHIDRATAQAKQGRNLYVTRGKKVLVLCKDCFQRSARTRFFKKSATD